MQLRYSYRIHPAPGQRIALARAFGCARTVFNDAVRMREDARKAGLPYITDASASKALTAAKKTPERGWLAGVSSVVLQQALADANSAYRNFFASITGKRKGPRLGAPRYHPPPGRGRVHQAALHPGLTTQVMSRPSRPQPSPIRNPPRCSRDAGRSPRGMTRKESRPFRPGGCQRFGPFVGVPLVIPMAVPAVLNELLVTHGTWFNASLKFIPAMEWPPVLVVLCGLALIAATFVAVRVVTIGTGIRACKG